MTYTNNFYDPDDLIEGAAMIYIVSASMISVPDEVMEGLLEDPEKLQAMLKVYSNVMIKGMIQMGFEHDDVQNRAHEMLEENEEELEELEELDEAAGKILKDVIGDDFTIMTDDDTEH
jgi:hypothetical protein